MALQISLCDLLQCTTCLQHNHNPTTRQPPNILSAATDRGSMDTIDHCISEMISNPFSTGTRERLVSLLESHPPKTRLHVFHDLLREHPDNRWLIRQRAIACTDNNLHDEACQAWLGLIEKYPRQIQFQEGLINAARPLRSAHRLKLLQLAQSKIAMGHYLQHDYDNAYHAFRSILTSQHGSGAKDDAKLLILYCIAKGEKSAVPRRLQHLPYKLQREKSIYPEPTALECCKILLQHRHLEEAAKLWAKFTINTEDYNGFLSQLCEELDNQKHQLEPTITLSVWGALVSAQPDSPHLLARFRATCEECLDENVAAQKVRALLCQYPGNTALFETLVQQLKLVDAEERFRMWKGLIARIPYKGSFWVELYLAHNKLRNRKDNPDSICMICTDRDLDTCFSSCGHVCCAHCAEAINRCHLCRTPIKDRVKVHAIVSNP
ncbi:hypothetical protein ASPSYDRAFT_1168217 [Aspergillus sydowii CBS 593.65]|uniref:RING-type domain-containing protein n=1 Tax=Aspergillus sydowii CBS 593.65 TaxID=1036612 RepID=A0A1L9TTB4_9EURO|nr:uncharacterized protein ASPSYDRAFT_1168217 [Aspergillus sydowii CBS 593.65]OJJ62687.1 hypothetical protein ASPSYDRAFT_1168217 [Aspergillus sydowii CBS 593.65]